MYRRLLTGALSLTLSCAAMAVSHPLAWCDSCSQAQIKMLALAKGGGRGHQIWIGDPTANQVHQFGIFYVQDDPSHCAAGTASCGHIDAFEQPVIDEIQDAFNTALVDYRNSAAIPAHDAYFQIVDVSRGSRTPVSP